MGDGEKVKFDNSEIEEMMSNSEKFMTNCLLTNFEHMRILFIAAGVVRLLEKQASQSELTAARLQAH